MLRLPSTVRRVVATAATGITLLAVTSTAGAHAEPAPPLGPRCPSLYVLGVQSEAEGTPIGDFTSDTGTLGQILGPVTAATGDLVQRAYVPYGHATDGTALEYRDATTEAALQLERMATEVVTRCPRTRIAAVGYAQGAPAVADFAHRVGHGESALDAGQIAAVALLANPDRAPGTPVLPGHDGTTPTSPPGSTGQRVASVALSAPSLTGQGIAAPPAARDYGALRGRVADLCIPGDATCDAPLGSPLAATVANIAARSDLHDPVAAISTISQALAATIYTTTVEAINDDLTGTSLDQLSYQPTQSLAERLAAASTPAAAPPGPEQALAAMFKIGTIGLNAAVTVARTVFTPATLAELATTGLANPWAAVAALGTKLASAIVELIPPQTALRWVDEAFQAITSTVTDRGELYTLASSARNSDTAGRQSTYAAKSATGSSSALKATADWLTAIARDLGATDQPVSPAPTTPSHTTVSAPMPAPSGAARPGSGG
ncbi:cutinase family protein [Nocardia sp. NPDC057227]|uniref:cutinase family protein n=1 Tax=Nocardia sp. NPDC057227 TaxID=3346056 RepID=UPI00363E71D1